MSAELLNGVRDQLLPMLRLVAEEYRHRVPAGYPVVLDAPNQGMVGIELEPSYALHITSDGEQLFADFYYRSPRNDARSSASREKFSGAPFGDHRPLGTNVTDQALRNLLAELISRWNFQPNLIHITDT